MPITGYSQEWLSLYNESVEYYNADQLDAALKAGEDALIRYKREGELDHTNYRAILRQLSVNCYSLNELDKAINYAQQEVESWRNASKVDESAYIDALDILGVLYASVSNYDKAVNVQTEALSLSKVAGNKSAGEIAIIQGHLAESLFGAGDYTNSRVNFEACLAVLEAEEEVPVDYINFSYSYGTLCVELQEYSKGITYLTTLFDYYDETELDPIIVNTNIGLGTAYTGIKDYAKGEKYYLLALTGIEALNYETNQIIEVKQKLAINLEQQGKSEDASALLAEISSDVMDNGSPGEGQALFLNSQATTMLNSGNVNEALATYDKALNMLDSLGLSKSSAYGTIGLNAIKANDLAGNLLIASEMASSIIEGQSQESITYYQIAAELGSILRRQGDFEGAEYQFESIFEADRSIWPTVQKGQILNKTASYYQVQGKFSQSGELYMEAMAIESIELNEGLYLSILYNYVTLLQAEGRLDEAEILLQDLKSSIGTENPEIYLGLLRNIGSLAQDKGDYSTAAARYNEALALALKMNNGEKGPQYADILLRIATLDKDLGNYQNAEPKFLEVTEIVAATQGIEHTNYARVANNMGVLYQLMGNYDKAEAKFQQAVTIYKNIFGEANPDYVLSLENLATLYELIGDEDKALEILATTLEANKLIYGVNNPNYAISLHNYASLLLKTDRKDEAYSMLVEVLQLQAASIGTMQPSYANSLHNLAILAQEQENYTLADSLINQVLMIRGTLFDTNHPSYTASLFSKAVLLQVTNQYDEAWEVYNQVINQYLNQISQYFPSLSELEKNAFYAKVTPVVNRYKEFCIEYYINYKQDPEVISNLYNVQLATKALLLNAVNKTRERIFASNDEQLIGDFNAWTNLKKQLVNYYSYTKEQIAAEGISIPALEEQANTIEKSLSKASNAFASEFEQTEVKWENVATSLGPDEATVELLRIERNGVKDSVTYAALVLHSDSDGPMLSTLPYGVAMDTKYFNYYKNTVKYKVHDQLSFNVFWKPIDDLLDGAKTIYISADGVYNKININTIYNINTDNYLIEDYFVKYVSSSKDLITSNSEQITGQSMLCIGDPAYDLNGPPNKPAILTDAQRSHLNMKQISPLPGTKEEIQFIDSLLVGNNWQVESYLGQEALESQLKQDKSPRVIHLATHGFFMQDLKLTDIESQTGLNDYDKNPLFRSGLLFAGASNIHEGVENDGVLTAYEAMNLYLDNTELIVLSACETALGDVKNGEGVYGLQRALVVAGAQKLIMSLWKVNDEATMQLMQLFYSNWANGGDLYGSLQKAQIQMLKEHDEPYYWGAFIMIGK